MSTTTGTKRAVLYLRVSSRGQMETDYDDDGLSIAAQRARCADEAAKNGAEVVEEYVERAESAKTNGRPELQRMLARIRQRRDIDYVIVWKVDRFARNRRDDANMLFEIESTGARLLSATENIDDTAAGQLMHGMLASFAEYYSRNLANEVIKGSTEKAKRGGTPGKVPPGYLNVRDMVNGYEVRTVALDPDRAPIVKWAFDAYASGLYSISDMVTLLEARGLRSRGTRKSPPKPLNASTVHSMLGNDYYVGVVTYRGQKFPGRHEPLISREIFDGVQAVLDAHRLSGERDRKHAHYLKGSIYCGNCGARLMYSRNTGRGGTYEYFVCSMRQRGGCEQGLSRVDDVAAKIEHHYRTIVLTDAQREGTRNALRYHLNGLQEVGEKEITRCTSLIEGLKNEERLLLRARYKSGISDDIFDEELARIQREREQSKHVLNGLNIRYEDIQATLGVGLDILADGIDELYLRADDTMRRLMNQAIFQAIWVCDEDVIGSQLTPEFAAITSIATGIEQAAVAYAATLPEPEGARARPSAVLAALMAPSQEEAPDPTGETGASVLGLIRTQMVARPGLEPGTPRFSVVCSTN